MLLQESTEKAVSISALLVWLPKGPWWDPTLFGLTFCCSSPPFSWAGAEEDVFISSGDAFSDAVGEGFQSLVCSLSLQGRAVPSAPGARAVHEVKHTQPGGKSSV